MCDLSGEWNESRVNAFQAFLQQGVNVRKPPRSFCTLTGANDQSMELEEGLHASKKQKHDSSGVTGLHKVHIKFI